MVVKEKRLIGKIKSFARLKGYGFIKADGLDDDIFVHYSNVITDEKFKTLHENDIVEFELHKDKLKALNVRILERSRSD